MKTVALIVAGGRGVRAGGEIPKQYQSIGNKTVLRHTLDRFINHPSIDAVHVVIRLEDDDLFLNTAEGLELLGTSLGGDTRQESCRNGLEALAAWAPENVLIHDAARPFVDDRTIDRIIDALETADGAIAAVAVPDTLKRTDADGNITETVDRQNVWRAQTPQGFKFDAILAAHRQTEHNDYTDDAAVAEAAGLRVVAVPGNEDNFKVTAPEDFARGEEKLAVNIPDFRIGSGFDVHPFEDGDFVTLCGLKVPHNKGLAGHSDSDVGLHAITDALLGTIADGDIGMHFPPSDDKWRGVDSGVFLKHAAGLVAEQGGKLRHLDVTLICEAPKIGPHRDKMRARLAELLQMDVSRISVKATTTDGLGFLGRREGIAAQATVTVLF